MFIRLFLHLEVVIFIYNNKGNTLAEALLAFSIFISCVVLFVSLLQVILVSYKETYQTYETYVLEQNEKEIQLWE